MVSKIFCNAAISIAGNIRHHRQVIGRSRACQCVHCQLGTCANRNSAESDCQQSANYRHNQVIGTDFTTDLADQKSVQSFQIKVFVKLRHLDKDNCQRVKQQQCPQNKQRACYLEIIVFLGRQNTVFIEQKTGNANADKRQQKQAHRECAVSRLQNFIFPVGCQQVDQLDTGYRPRIE